MMLAAHTLRTIEADIRRAPGAFRFVDAATLLPVLGPVSVEVRGATVGDPRREVPLHERGVRLVRNGRGVYAVLEAPFFAAYTAAFDDPRPPGETDPGRLRLRVAVVDPGPAYLPQQFELELPRPLDPVAPDSVFVPRELPLFRAPSAPVQDGWAVLRVRVAAEGASPGRGLPGVLVRVFAAPRAAGDAPIGVGMTDWRGGILGEALVPICGLPRFRPGAGDEVIATELAVEFEAIRDAAFSAGDRQWPDVPRILSGTGEGIIRPPDQPPGSRLTIVRPPTPVRVRAGRHYAIELAMP